MRDDCVIVLGARGSLPVSGKEFSVYGGATTCVLVRLGGQQVLLDAGTGLLRLPPSAMETEYLPLLLTHPHADHLLGLPLCPYLFRPDVKLELFARERQGLDAREQVRRLYSPPVWPVEMEQLPANVMFRDLPQTIQLGAVTVETMEGAHPGGVSLVRLTAGGKCVVFMSDCTVDETSAEELAFAKDCDLLLIDGQYSDEEMSTRHGFGHSAWRDAADFARACRAANARITHHDPSHTDDVLDVADAEVRAVYDRCCLAREGEEILL